MESARGYSAAFLPGTTNQHAERLQGCNHADDRNEESIRRAQQVDLVRLPSPAEMVRRLQAGHARTYRGTTAGWTRHAAARGRAAAAIQVRQDRQPERSDYACNLASDPPCDGIAS